MKIIQKIFACLMAWSIYADAYLGIEELGNLAIFYYWLFIVLGFLFFISLARMEGDKELREMDKLSEKNPILRFISKTIQIITLVTMIACAWTFTAVFYGIVIALLHIQYLSYVEKTRGDKK